MCGIFGYSALTEASYGMLPWLAKEMEGRGKDSWGGTNGFDEIKKIGRIRDSWEFPRWQQAIYHTRNASTGEVSIPNQHPFKFAAPDGYVIGVHNGIVSNHEALNRKHSRDFAVDSMHLFANLAEGRSMEEIEGWGALAWFEVVNTKPTLKFARFNMDSLTIARLPDGAVVFASTKTALEEAIWWGTKFREGVTYFVVDSDKLYAVRDVGMLANSSHESGHALGIVGDLKFGTRGRYTSSAVATTLGGSGNFFPGLGEDEDGETAWYQHTRHRTNTNPNPTVTSAVAAGAAKVCIKCTLKSTDGIFCEICENALSKLIMEGYFGDAFKPATDRKKRAAAGSGYTNDGSSPGSTSNNSTESTITAYAANGDKRVDGENQSGGTNI